MKSVRLPIVLLSCCAAGLWAQSESGRAALEGVVADTSAKAVQGAVISVQDTETGFSRSVAERRFGRGGPHQRRVYERTLGDSCMNSVKLPFELMLMVLAASFRLTIWASATNGDFRVQRSRLQGEVHGFRLANCQRESLNDRRWSRYRRDRFAPLN